MLTELFEAIDKKVFTPQLKESLEAKFNESVDIKAKEIADVEIEKTINSLNEKSEEHINYLNKKAEEYVKIQKDEIIDSLDKYLERIVEEFITEMKDTLKVSIRQDKSALIIEAFESMLKIGGSELSNVIKEEGDKSVKTKLDESVSKYDSLVEENIRLKEENENLLKIGLITEAKDGLSIIEAEKFEKMANLVGFTKNAEYMSKLEIIKESVKGTINKIEKQDDADDKKPIWAHLI